MAPYRRILTDYNKSRCEHDCEKYYLSPPESPPPPLPPLPVLPSPIPSPLTDGSAGDHEYRHNINNYVLVAASLAAAVFLLTFTFCAVLRRRRVRRSILSASFRSNQGADGSGAGGGFFEDEGDGGIHHVWYIRTVGLDEATIGSIAVTEYKAGSGLLGAADCSVCLGEFQDGELVRLLPKCGHAFHVSCIDTWLRSHVNCPLCRAHIVDPAGEAPPSDSSTVAVGNPVGELGSLPTSEYSEAEAQAGNLEEEMSTGAREIPIDQLGPPDLTGERSEMQDSSDLGDSGLQPVRRSVSMDSPFMVLEEQVNEDRKEPNSQEEQSFNQKEKHGNCSKAASTQLGLLDMERSLSGSGRGFFFSRHGRARSSILPL